MDRKSVKGKIQKDAHYYTYS